jgi:hypothetical protein
LLAKDLSITYIASKARSYKEMVGRMAASYIREQGSLHHEPCQSR